MEPIKIKLFVLLLLIPLLSCTKESEPASQMEIKFRANLDGEQLTKASQPFEVGVKSLIYVYKATDQPESINPIANSPIEATGSSGGVLTTASPVYLPKGSYDFYSVSINDKTSFGPTITQGVSGSLTNKVDYLWAKCAPVNEGGTVIFEYGHKAVKVIITLTQGSGVSNLNVTSIKITPSKPSANTKLALSSGQITAATQTGDLDAMKLEANSGSYIMLPLSSNPINIEIEANLTIAGASHTGKKYSATIPAQAYQGGSCYLLSLSVNASSVTFNGATVKDWDSKNISSITLTEQ